MKHLGTFISEKTKHLGLYAEFSTEMTHTRQETFAVVDAFYIKTHEAEAQLLTDWRLSSLDPFSIEDLDDYSLWEVNASWYESADGEIILSSLQV